MASLSALLAQLSPDNKTKGDQFEKLVKWFLENDPEYKALLKKVYRWDSSPHRWGKDTGIDLTAEGHDGKLWAIQAKAYEAEYYVTKPDIQKFLTETGRRPTGRRCFDVKLLVATTDNVGATARKALEDTPGVCRLLRADLEKVQIAWPRNFEALKPPKLQCATPKPYQLEAIRAVVKGFKKSDRGQLLMACGTGKTLTALWTSETLKARRVLVLVPSLSLVRQTLKEWYTHGKHTPPYLVVCSDQSVQGGEELDELVSKTSEIGVPTTTDPTEVAAFLKGRGHRYVFSTYHSSPQIAAAFKKHRNLPGFDLILGDEAHRIAGSPDAAFSTVLDTGSIKAKRRLFMTATPRYVTGRLKREAAAQDIELASMDDETKFGPAFHKLPFTEAIKRGLLTDYQVAVVVVDDETQRLAAERGEYVRIDGKRIDARTIGCQLGLARGMHNFNLRKVVTFHSRVKWAASFAESFPAAVELLPKAKRPSGTLWCRHVSGAQSTRERDTELMALKGLNSDTRGLIANARCLTEGVDVPTLDGVAFIDPRRSEVDVVQAVGRAIRKSKDKTIGTIVIPVFVGKRADAAEALETSAFKPVWQVIEALRAHDDMLASELDDLRREIGRRGTTGKLPAKLKVLGAKEISADFANAFDTMLVEYTTAKWDFSFGVLEAFAKREGGARVPTDHIERGFNLGGWVATQRSFHAKDKLSAERTKHLERVSGWAWDARIDAWEEGFNSLQTFVQREGHARIGATHREGHFELGSWVRNQRSFFTQGRLEANRRSRLDGIDGWTWDPFTDAWQVGLQRLQNFVKREGHAQVSPDHKEQGAPLGTWVGTQRTKRSQGKLSQERIEALQEIPGWSWDPRSDAWEKGFRSLQAFANRLGHARVPPRYVEGGYRLGSWVASQRIRHSSGKLSPDQIARLQKMPGWTWDARTDAWEEAFACLKAFIKREGNCNVPDSHREKRFNLGVWVGTQRSFYKRGKLSTDRALRLERSKGWSWDPKADAWDSGFKSLRSFAKREGHARVPSGHVEHGFKLGAWVVGQRSLKAKGNDSEERSARLENIEGWTWNSREDGWERAFATLELFARREGHARVPRAHVEMNFRLGEWVVTQRSFHGRGELPEARKKRLERVNGWSWDTRSDAWEDGFKCLRSFVKREGHARVNQTVTLGSYPLGSWVNTQRTLYSRARLSDEQVRRLEAVKGWSWDPYADDWEKGFGILQAFAKREKHAFVPQSYKEGPFRLGAWVNTQRHKYAKGKLPIDRTQRLVETKGWSWRPGKKNLR